MRPTESETRVRRLPRAQQLDRVRAVMERELTEKQRRAVEDYYLQGLKIPEMARRYGVNRSTVSRTLRRGMARLQRFLRY